MFALARLVTSIAALLSGGVPFGGGTVGVAPGAEGGYCDPATGCTGGTVFYANSAQQLFVVDLGGDSPRTRLVGSFAAEITDLARSPDGRLFGVTFRSLALIDQRTGRATIVGSLGVDNVNGLAWGGGELLASSTDGLLYRVDPTTGHATTIGPFGSGITSSGDLCFGPGGALYMTAPESSGPGAVDRLVRIDVRTGAGAVVGSTGLSRIYGLAWAAGSLVGLTESGVVARIDPDSGAATVLGQGGTPFWGAS